MADRRSPEQLAGNPVVRAGVVAWCVIGIVLVAAVAVWAATYLWVVVVPLVLAMFPAALIEPVTRWLRARGVPSAVAALLSVLGLLGVLAGLLVFIGFAVAEQAAELGEAISEGYEQIRRFVAEQLDAELPAGDELVASARQWLGEQDGVGGTVFAATRAAVEGVTAFILLWVILFFYLKDGGRLVRPARRLLPPRWRGDADVMAARAWDGLGAFLRSQLIVAAVDAVFIGIGLVLLGVPLALPLAVLVFLGGLVPIVGAFASGTVAVMVALADGGLGLALAVLVLIVVVQQAESNLLEPFIVGRVVHLHPLAVLVAVTVGVLTAGIFGAFVAVPLLAAGTRAVDHVRERNGGDDGGGHHRGSQTSDSGGGGDRASAAADAP